MWLITFGQYRYNELILFFFLDSTQPMHLSTNTFRKVSGNKQCVCVHRIIDKTLFISCSDIFYPFPHIFHSKFPYCWWIIVNIIFQLTFYDSVIYFFWNTNSFPTRDRIADCAMAQIIILWAESPCGAGHYLSPSSSSVKSC